MAQKKNSKGLISTAHVQALKGKPRRIELPELGGHAYLLSPPLADLLEMLEAEQGGATQLRAVVKLAQKCITDENGRPIFTEEDLNSFDADQVTALSNALQFGAKDSDGEAAEGNA